jgi:diphthine synthase
MALHFIGLGLRDEKSITVEGLHALKNCDVVYLESYTSVFTDASFENFSKHQMKKVILADRELVENSMQEIIDKAKKNNVAFCVIGDPFSATTHIELYRRAREGGIEVNVINNASVLTAVGIVGLELYKYGKTTSIPFNNENVLTPYRVFMQNRKIGLHTLVLLDLDPQNHKFMSCREAADYLISSGLKKNEMVVACSQLGGKSPMIKYCRAKDVPLIKKFPQCLILPGKLHFVEEEVLKSWS